MNATHIDFMVEEASMETLLRGLLTRFLKDTSYAIYRFQCKHNLLAELPKRLKGYRAWLPETYRIVVIVDRDGDECQELKKRLEHCAEMADLATRSQPRQNRFSVVNRIVVEELEAWYFGDWKAVCAAYPRVPARVPKGARFRDPDAIAGGTWEAFERVLQRAGYFDTGLRKIEAAREIAAHMDPARNSSHSFQVFWQTLVELAKVC